MNAFVDLGVITAIKGLKGEVKVKSFGDKQLLLSTSKFFLSPPTLLTNTLTVESISQSKDLMVIKFKEIIEGINLADKKIILSCRQDELSCES